jgi:hypothetical protein
MPRAKWMSDSDYAAFERCLKKVDGAVNKYAVCMSAIKKRKRKRDSDGNRKALSKVGKKK